jgi:hypothetical protein
LPVVFDIMQEFPEHATGWDFVFSSRHLTLC